MRIVFFGSGEFGVPTLAALRRHHDLALIVTQPDRSAGRNRQMTPTAVALWAERMKLTVLKPEKVNDPAIVEMIKLARPDANVVVAFGQKIGHALIASPALGAAATVNLHASLLPKYRGAAPINWAMIRGETVTGNTVFSLVERMDAGPILASQSTPIDQKETAGELHDRLSRLGGDLVTQALAGFESGTIAPQPQDDAAATPAPKLSKADAVIDFSREAVALRCQIHGLTPWPGVAVWYAADEKAPRQSLMLRRVQSLPEHHHRRSPGELIGEDLIATGGGALRVLEVQPPGKRQMSWRDFARGQRWGEGGVRFFGAEK